MQILAVLSKSKRFTSKSKLFIINLFFKENISFSKANASCSNGDPSFPNANHFSCNYKI